MDTDNEDALFTRDGLPVIFFLHKSIHRKGARDTLTDNIETHGGCVVDDHEEADVVLVDVSKPTGNLHALRNAYYRHSDPRMRSIYVERMNFVQNCIRMGRYEHLIERKKRMGGYVGRTRTNYTEQDEEKLCEYLAITLPRADMGGRQGNNVYKQMCSSADVHPEEYEWTKRHTWQSWRDHYKHNQDRMDAMIEQMAAEIPEDPKNTYQLSRQAPKSTKTMAKIRMDLAEEEEEEEEEGEEDEDYELDDEEEPEPPRPLRANVDERPRVSTQDKGKVKEVVDEEDIDTDIELFGFHPSPPPREPAPNTQVTLVAFPVTPSRPTQASSSQTILGSAKQTKLKPLGTHASSDSESEHGNAPILPDPPSSILARHRLTRLEHRPGDNEDENIAPPRPAANPPSPSKPKPAPPPKPKPKAPPRIPADAPSLNTRSHSRSRSVEPQPLVLPSKRRKKDAAMEPLPEEPMEESAEAEAGSYESLDEEMNVADDLMVDKERDETQTAQTKKKRPRSLDTDDEQIYRKLNLSRTKKADSPGSSMSSYPISGTRASALKKMLEKESMDEPYTPPLGTRAAQEVLKRSKRKLGR